MHENLERWLLTYSDLITLLLAIFVLMYAFSKIKEGNPNTLELKDQEMETVAPTESTFLTEAQKEAEEKKFRKLRTRLEKRLKKKNFTPYVKIVSDSRGLLLRLKSQALFESGEADLTPRARAVLDELQKSMGDVPGNAIRVEGHTDDVPIHTTAFPSNWHLSTSRAISVIFYLINRHHMAPERFQAQGFADRRPLKPNDSDANRAENRRVEIFIIKRGMEYVQRSAAPGEMAPSAAPRHPPPAPEAAPSGPASEEKAPEAPPPAEKAPEPAASATPEAPAEASPSPGGP